jgi:hypothetical protein
MPGYYSSKHWKLGDTPAPKYQLLARLLDRHFGTHYSVTIPCPLWRSPFPVGMLVAHLPQLAVSL